LETPFLSIIIPVHNEERRLPSTIEQALQFLDHQSFSTELILVENGSQDRTLEIARTYAAQNAQIKVIQAQARGKGLAVRQGMLEARGEYRFMADADFSMSPQEINRFLPPALVDADIAIASREAPGAIRYGEPAYRHFVGRIFNLLIRTLALPGFNDTQCGFKCWRAGVAEDLFPYQTLTGWAFDVEILYIARQRGYRIVELPIPWHYNADSKVEVVRDSIEMARDLLRIRWNSWRGRYRGKH
jgi:glycosyltransferase involved in cell wall biosynthesis